MFKRLAVAGLIAAGLVLLFFGWPTIAIVTGGAQDLPRSNDRILDRSVSPDRAFEAFVVLREADSQSADVLKVFIAPRGHRWFEGQMMMMGRRFSNWQGLYWVTENRLCMIASSDGVEERRDRTRIGGRQTEFFVRASMDACER
jgi:hypothetical protein